MQKNERAPSCGGGLRDSPSQHGSRVGTSRTYSGGGHLMNDIALSFGSLPPALKMKSSTSWCHFLLGFTFSRYAPREKKPKFEISLCRMTGFECIN